MIGEGLRRDLARSEYGGLVPVLPLTAPPEHCPRGHNSQIARVLVGYSHIYCALTVTPHDFGGWLDRIRADL